MDASYRLGVSIVLGTVIVSAGLCLRLGLLGRPEMRAGQDLGGHPFDLGAFRLVERSGRVVTDADLADRVWVAAFIFTRCPMSCPRITSVMKGLGGKLADTGVQLVSLSVDPAYDTPEVLADFARRYGADPDRWWFLTGRKADIERLVVERFKLGLETGGRDDHAKGAEAILHSPWLALVDRGNKVVGYFDSNDPEAVSKLLGRARRCAVPAWVRRLPAVNAMLNGTCTLLLLTGWSLIRSRRVRGHAACMVAGVVVSTLFLGCYVVYHIEVRGSVPFRGDGPIRLVYYTILMSHVVLAVAIVPLVALTLIRALRRRFHHHARLAKVTFPVWLYVSITGVVIYWMLYQLPRISSTAG
ncbi:MAG: DUF420 domain-containing protein [Singulisphaera sp.]|nr:DUF420 domain-containing protein [Singulisphaera sp.]